MSKKSPSELAGIKPGSKRAAVYDYLAGRVEASCAEIANGVAPSGLFTSDKSALRKEVSGHVRAMVLEGLARDCGGEPRCYAVVEAPESGPSGQDQSAMSAEMASQSVADVCVAMAGKATQDAPNVCAAHDHTLALRGLPVDGSVVEVTRYLVEADGSLHDSIEAATGRMRALKILKEIDGFLATLPKGTKIREAIIQWEMR